MQIGVCKIMRRWWLGVAPYRHCAISQRSEYRQQGASDSCNDSTGRLRQPRIDAQDERAEYTRYATVSSDFLHSRLGELRGCMESPLRSLCIAHAYPAVGCQSRPHTSDFARHVISASLMRVGGSHGPRTSNGEWRGLELESAKLALEKLDFGRRSAEPQHHRTHIKPQPSP